MTELRCPSRLHGILLDNAVIEVKCRNSRCGAQAGVVVLHHFDAHTGQLIDTKRYSDPGKV